MIEVIINGQVVEVEDSDVDSLAEFLKSNRPPDYEKLMAEMAGTMKDCIHELSEAVEEGLKGIKIPEPQMIPMLQAIDRMESACERGLAAIKIPEAPTVVIPKPEKVAPVLRVLVGNIERGRNNLIESFEVELIRG